MAVKKIFNTAKAFRDFIEQNSTDFKDLYIKEIYNIGNAEYRESPLFLYSGYSVIMIFLSNGVLSMNIYDKDFFIQHIRAGIFREYPDSEELYHFSFTNSRLINDYVQSINIVENSGGTIDKTELVFKNGKNLYIIQSELVEEAMCSYVSEQ